MYPLNTESNDKLTTADVAKALVNIRYGIRRVPTGTRHSNVYHVVNTDGRALHGTGGLWFATRRTNAAAIVSLLNQHVHPAKIICGGRFV
jgi:hypothetical protein